MKNLKYPIHFQFSKSQNTFKTNIQKLYHEMSVEERSRFIKQKQEQGCSVTCHCQPTKPVPLRISHKGMNYYLKNNPNAGHLHRRDCFFHLPPSEKHRFWEPVNGRVKLPFSVENNSYQKRETAVFTSEKRTSAYRPTLTQLYEQLFIQAHTHFLNTSLKKEQAIIPSLDELQFYLKLKLEQFELSEGLLLSELYLEIPTFSSLQKRRADLVTRYLLNWDRAQFFIAHPLTDLKCFEWNDQTYTLLTVVNPKTKKTYQLACSGDFTQKLHKRFNQSPANLLTHAQLWVSGWLPVQQKNTPVFEEKKIPLLSKESRVLCLALNGCLVHHQYDLMVFNAFAKANQPLRCCFYGEKYSPIKGDTFPNALWIQQEGEARQHQSIYISPPYREEAEKQKQILQLQTESSPLWIWDVKKDKKPPLLPFFN